MPAKIVMKWDEDLSASPIREMTKVCDSFRYLSTIATPAMARTEDMDTTQIVALNNYRSAVMAYHEAVVKCLEECRVYIQNSEALKLQKDIEKKIGTGHWDRDDRRPFASRVNQCRNDSMAMLYRLGSIRCLAKINTDQYTDIVEIRNSVHECRVPSVAKAISDLFNESPDNKLQIYQCLSAVPSYSPSLARKTFNKHGLDVLARRCDNIYQSLMQLHNTVRKCDSYMKRPQLYNAPLDSENSAWFPILMEASRVLTMMDLNPDALRNMKWDGPASEVKTKIYKIGLLIHKKIQKANLGYVFGDIARRCVELENPALVYHRFVNLYVDFQMHEYGQYASGKNKAGFDAYNTVGVEMMPRQSRINRIYQDSYVELMSTASIDSDDLKTIETVIGWKYIEDPWSCLIRPSLNTDMILYLLKLGVDPMKNSGYLCRTIAALPPDTHIGEYTSVYDFVVDMFESKKADAFDLPCMWINNCLVSMNSELLLYLVTPNSFNYNHPWLDPFCNDNMLIRDLLYGEFYKTLANIATVLPKEKVQAIVNEMDHDATLPKYVYEINRIQSDERNSNISSAMRDKIRTISQAINLDEDAKKEKYLMTSDAYSRVLAHRDHLRAVLPLCKCA